MTRIVLGLVALLVVLAVVGSLAKKQLQALPTGIATRQGPAAAGDASTTPSDATAAASAPSLTAPEQAGRLERQLRDDTVRALQQGVDRNAHADDE